MSPSFSDGKWEGVVRRAAGEESVGLIIGNAVPLIEEVKLLFVRGYDEGPMALVGPEAKLLSYDAAGSIWA